MSTELWLQESRNVIAQAGASVSLDFSKQNRKGILDAFAAGELECSNLYIDWVGEVAMAPPSFDMPDMSPTEWTTTGTWAGAAYLPKPFHKPTEGGYSSAMRSQLQAHYKLNCLVEQPFGQALLVALLTYPQSVDQDSIDIYFGGVWKLTLRGEGDAGLYRDAGDGEYADCVSQFDWMSAEKYAPATHRLMIYEVGPKLVISNPTPNRDGDYLGTSFLDETAMPDPNLSSDDPQFGVVHAIRAGYPAFEGNGVICISCCRQRYAKGPSTLGQPHQLSVGLTGEGSTLPVETTAYGADLSGLCTPTITVYDQDGDVWPQDAYPEQLNTALSWSLSFDNSDSVAASTYTRLDTFMLSAVNITVPPLQLPDGSVGTNLLAIRGVADQRITATREGDLTRDRLSATLFTVTANLAAYCQPNMTVRWVSDGLTRFRGFTGRTEWTTHTDPFTVEQAIGTLQLEAEGQWSRFRRAMWSGGAPFDGCRLTDCLKALAAAAGLTAADYEIVDDPFIIPAPPRGESPAFEYRPGTKIDRIIEDLRDKFFGLWLVAFFRVSDGKFVVEYNPAYTTGVDLAAYFYASSAEAAAAGNPRQTILSGTYQEQLDQSDMANVVTVIGQDYNYRPILARCVDWSSIHTMSASNYVGEPWHLIVVDPSLTTQGAVNWACRSLFDRHRYPKIFAQWRSVRVDVWPGDFVQLIGTRYGSIYQLKGVTFEQANQGDAVDPMGRASYSAEVVLTAAQIAELAAGNGPVAS